MTAKSRMSSSPTQYTGKGDAEVGEPEREPIDETAGSRALSTPSVMPQIVARSIAAPASCSVFGKRSTDVLRDRAVGDVRAAEIALGDAGDVVAELHGSGSSSRSCCAQPRDGRLSARSPTIASTGSPGAT